MPGSALMPSSSPRPIVCKTVLMASLSASSSTGRVKLPARRAASCSKVITCRTTVFTGCAEPKLARLTEVFRQAARSRIVTSAHGINRGAIPNLSRPEGDSDFYYVQADDPETADALMFVKHSMGR